MFKASIILVLIAFGALAYGWVANDDTILYGSIGASILAGLFLLRATLADRKAGYAGEPKSPRRERPPREARERKPSKKSEAATAPRQRRGSGRLESGEVTRQLKMPAAGDDYEDEPLPPLRGPNRRRESLPDAPEGAAWAEAEQGYDETELEEESRGLGVPSFDDGYEDEPYDDGYDEPAAQSTQGVAAADDFRSRLAAVLGTTGEESPPPPPPRARRVTPVTPVVEEAPPAPEAPTPPRRRGRRKATETFYEPEPEPEVEPETEQSDPEWSRIEEAPSIPQPVRIARPSPSDEMIHYRPRRPAVAAIPEEAAEDEPAETPAPGRSAATADPDAKIRPVRGRRPGVPRSSGVTRVSPAEKTRAKASRDQDPDAPPPRRGRPPRPKP